MSTQQTGQALPFQAFYTAGKTGKTGLTVTATVYNPAGTAVVTAAACTEIGNGLYAYTLASGSVLTAGEYVCIFHTADTGVNQQDMAANWEVGASWAMNLDAAVTTRATPTNITAASGVALAASQHVIVDSGTVTTLSNLPAAPTDWLAAAAVKADAVTKIQLGLATPTNITAGTIGSVTNDVGITQAGADKVWGSTSRTLSSFGTLVADTAAAAATAVWAAGTRTLSAFGFTVAATVADKTGYSLSTGGVQAVWDALLTALTSAGSIGKKLADWTVNADTSGTTTLLTRLTANRAGYLDNLSAGAVALAASLPTNFAALGISSGGKINEVTLTDTATTLTNAPTGQLDAAGIRGAVGLATANLDTQLNALPTAAENGAQTRVELATELARIDVATSTRNATAPDNTGIAANGVLLIAVKAKTDNLPASPAATGAAMTLTSAYDAAKTAATQASITALQATADDIHAHASADPLDATVPGTYAEGTAGFNLGKFNTPDPATPLIPIPGPTEAGKCGVYLYSQLLDGTVRDNIEVTFTLSAWPTHGATGLVAESVTFYTDATGFFSGILDRTDDMLPTGRTYIVNSPGFGLKNKVLILDDTTLVDNAYDLKKLFV